MRTPSCSAASLGQNGLRSPPSSLHEGKHKITNFLNGLCMGLFGGSMNLQHDQPYLSKSMSACLHMACNLVSYHLLYAYEQENTCR
jgi:hypothetical protein